MKTALFTNFSTEEFIGYWDGKGKKFAPGESVYMPDYLAQHFAKHLVNRELLRVKPDGTSLYKDGEKMTSPKRPNDVPMYMDLFTKAYMADSDEPMAHDGDSVDTSIETVNRNRQGRNTESSAQQGTDGSQIVLPPDDEDDGDESSFINTPATIVNGAQGVNLNI